MRILCAIHPPEAIRKILESLVSSLVSGLERKSLVSGLENLLLFPPSMPPLRFAGKSKFSRPDTSFSGAQHTSIWTEIAQPLQRKCEEMNTCSRFSCRTSFRAGAG